MVKGLVAIVITGFLMSGSAAAEESVPAPAFGTTSVTASGGSLG